MKYLFIPFVLLFLYSCESNIEKINSIQSKDLLPDISIAKVETKYSEATIFKGKLVAPILNHYLKGEQSYYDFPKGITVYFYDSLAREESTMKADYAIFYEKKELWEARGNVVLTNKNGSKLTTQQLFGDQKQKKIYSVKYVKIQDTDGSVVDGKDGFESNQNFTVYKFKNVNGTVFVNEEFREAKEK